MSSFLKRRVIATPLDRAEGAIGPKRLAILVAVLLVVGAAIIFLAQHYIASNDTWEATVTGVAPAGQTISFTFDEDSDDSDVASYPSGMVIKEGDRVLIRVDEDKGNLVVRVLDE